MIQYENIQKALGIEIAVSEEMSKAIYRWTKMYMNKAPWISGEVKGLNLPAAIASEMARLVTMEAEINITGSERAGYIAASLKPFLSKLPIYVEYACATGGVVFKPYLSDAGIEIDIVKAGDFFPVSFDSAGNITAAVFPEFKRMGKRLYTRLEYQEWDGSRYRIVNKAFVSSKAVVKTDDVVNLGQEIRLADVPEWHSLEPFVEFHNADRMLFSYFRIPLANNEDMDSPLGVSIFARAVGQIRDADEQYGATLWEFRSKETAIQAADEFFRRDRKGNPILPKGRERLYRAMGPGIQSKDGSPFFNAYSPEIRDESFFREYNRIVQKVEFNSGLAYGTLSDPQVVDKTAEEVKTSKQRSYATVKSIQNSLDDALAALTGAIGAWLDIEKMMPPGEAHAICTWDDSMVVDKETERKQDIQDVAIGAMQLYEYRMKWRGEDEKTAKMMVAKEGDVLER